MTRSRRDRSTWSTVRSASATRPRRRCERRFRLARGLVPRAGRPGGRVRRQGRGVLRRAQSRAARRVARRRSATRPTSRFSTSVAASVWSTATSWIASAPSPASTSPPPSWPSRASGTHGCRTSSPSRKRCRTNRAASPGLRGVRPASPRRARACGVRGRAGARRPARRPRRADRAQPAQSADPPRRQPRRVRRGVSLLRAGAVVSLVERAGLEKLEVVNTTFLPLRGRFARRVEEALMRVPLGAQYAVLARKVAG